MSVSQPWEEKLSNLVSLLIISKKVDKFTHLVEPKRVFVDSFDQNLHVGTLILVFVVFEKQL